jgi:DNA-binding GntR family transcriptional regulator
MDRYGTGPPPHAVSHAAARAGTAIPFRQPVSGRVQVGIEHHGRILAALESRDVEATVRAMEDHLVESLQALMSAADRG